MRSLTNFFSERNKFKTGVEFRYQDMQMADIVNPWVKPLGYDNDIFRNGNAGRTPLQDRPAYGDTMRFGSAHPGGCMFVLCDGSVRMIAYTVDGVTFGNLCNRKDHAAIDASKL